MSRPIRVLHLEDSPRDAEMIRHRLDVEDVACDILVANEVGVDKTFGQDTNTVHILRRGVDAVVQAGPASKDSVAATVWDVIQDVLSSG